MADKLEMKSMDKISENIQELIRLFPNIVKESKNSGGGVQNLIDFDALKAELSYVLIDDKQERYQMTWPDKKKAVLLANQAISATLRPDKEKSVNFDTTENLYIEGDNLDVLKLLRETYLGKVKMIYIDPPYNTGNDFIYEDDFSQSAEDYAEISGEYDEQGNRLVKNVDSNGRFHTDWLNMIYPRLKVARDLLSDDGVICISIDDNEQSNLKKLCDEVYGETNFISSMIWKSKSGGANDVNTIACDSEYVLVYSKNIACANFNLDTEAQVTTSYNQIDEKGRKYSLDRLDKQSLGYQPSLDFPIIGPDGREYIVEHKNLANKVARWRWSKETVRERYNELVFKYPYVYTKNYEKDGIVARNLLIDERFGRTRTGKTEVAELFGKIAYFSFPKPTKLLKFLIGLVTDKNSIVIDFFSGSSTTAHAVMQLNAEDGGKRKFIMVQLPEKCDEKSEAYKAGYKTICDIGEERIRRAGKKIKGENPNAKALDVGFRVLRLDSSNMQDVYYNPNLMTRTLLEQTIDNIKPDRTPMDLLFQVMLDLGVELSAKIEEKSVNGKTYYAVNGNDIIACFDENIDNAIIVDIAKQKPLYAVFRDKSFGEDSVGINNEQLFKTYSPATVIKVL